MVKHSYFYYLPDKLKKIFFLLFFFCCVLLQITPLIIVQSLIWNKTETFPQFMKQLQHKSVKFLCGLGCFPVDNNAVKWGEIQQKKKKKADIFWS